jgi:hypothetical protein
MADSVCCHRLPRDDRCAIGERIYKMSRVAALAIGLLLIVLSVLWGSSRAEEKWRMVCDKVDAQGLPRCHQEEIKEPTVLLVYVMLTGHINVYTGSATSPVPILFVDRAACEAKLAQLQPQFTATASKIGPVELSCVAHSEALQKQWIEPSGSGG